MMRLPKSDLFLFNASASAETSPAGPPPVPPLPDNPVGLGPVPPRVRTTTATTVATGASVPPATADLRFELTRALPALWAKAQRDFADGRADREKEKLRELILWLLSKKCADVRQRQSINFQHEGRRTSGRIDVVAFVPGKPSLAIEMDWAYARKSLEKLQAAHRQGQHVLWVCGAVIDKDAARALRARANLEFGPTYSWLYMFHLVHGWL